jgi:hypothetical protein
MVGAVAACAAALVLSAAGSAGAVSPGTWTPATNLPSGTTSITDQVLSSPTGALLRYAITDGYPTLAPFGPDGLGAAVRIPGASYGAIPAAVAFLPGGAAIVSYYKFNSGPLQLILRRADGTFGPTYNTAATVGSNTPVFAVRAGEVLIIKQDYNDVERLTAQSLSIGSDGTLTPTAEPAAIYIAPGNPPDIYGTNIEAPVAGLDANGEAEATFVVDHVSTTGNEILTTHRTAAGSWSTPRSISAGLPNAQRAGQLKGAVAPGGRTLIGFQTNDGTLTKTTLYRGLREPGATFGAPVLVNDLAGAGGANNTFKVASGGDGTLALGVYAYQCQTQLGSEVPAESFTALVVPPGKDLASYGVGVLRTADDHSRFTALGAGGGNAIVGLNDQQTTDGNSDNVCDNPNLANNSGTVSDRATIVGAKATIDHTFGSGTFAQNGNGSVKLAVDAAGIDASGNAAVTGRLAISDVPASAWFQDDEQTDPGGPGDGDGDGGTPGGGGAGASGGASGTPATSMPGATKTPPVVSPPAPINKSVSPNPGPLTLSSAGLLTFSLTAPHFSNPNDVLTEQILIQVFAGNARTSAKAKPRVIGAVRKTVKLRSGQKLTVRIKLTAKMKSYLKHHRTATVQLQLTSQQTGHAKTVKTKTIKPKRKG